MTAAAKAVTLLFASLSKAALPALKDVKPKEDAA